MKTKKQLSVDLYEGHGGPGWESVMASWADVLAILDAAGLFMPEGWEKPKSEYGWLGAPGARGVDEMTKNEWKDEACNRGVIIKDLRKRLVGLQDECDGLTTERDRVVRKYLKVQEDLRQVMLATYRKT